MSKTVRSTFLLAAFAAACLFASCKSSPNSQGSSIFGTGDQTAQAAELVAQANQDLTKIKILYDQNEGKRLDIKKAMEANDTETAKRIANEVEKLINDGATFANDAIDKLQKAQEMEINDDYREYLRLKEQSLKLESDAFDNYRQAAKVLNENFDPKDTVKRDKVKVDFKAFSDKYLDTMERARDYSYRANELAKEVAEREQN
ncbi:MAG: hypothetical protein DYH05_13925 [Acidobacteria bacterium ACB1]|nr:hypothetical protein [Pyrinomonadaceae bacterium]MCE7963572.1 hypothetical protein [Acidobacteria bacterium ACB1]